ncbi:MAG: hypothetical protein JWO45_685 [Spartobacteria bacterium]|nr:hypothetical protein [Spartobacteria bacterium]
MDRKRGCRKTRICVRDEPGPRRPPQSRRTRQIRRSLRRDSPQSHIRRRKDSSSYSCKPKSRSAWRAWRPRLFDPPNPKPARQHCPACPLEFGRGSPMLDRWAIDFEKSRDARRYEIQWWNTLLRPMRRPKRRASIPGKLAEHSWKISYGCENRSQLRHFLDSTLGYP